MWCMVEQQHVLAPPPAAAAARAAAGPCARSKGRCASSRPAAPACRLALGAGSAVRSTSGRRDRPGGAITCTGWPPPAAKAVRSASWRAHDLARGCARRAATSSGPARRTAAGCCRPGCPARAGRGTTAAAGRRTAGSRLARRRHQRRRRRRALRPRTVSISAARPATVGTSNSARSGSSTPKLAHPRHRAGWPAASGRRGRRSRRATPTRSSAQHLATRSRQQLLDRRRGERCARSVRRRPHAGRRQRAPVHLAAGRSAAARPAYEDGGTMCSGSRWRRNVPQLRGGEPRAGATDRPPGQARRAVLATRHHHRLADPGWRRSTASTSPSSMRKPRTFTWRRAGPGTRCRPSASQRTRSPVR